MARIAIDCDGVLACFTDGAIEIINTLWPGRIPDGYSPPDWYFSDVGMTSADWNRVFERIKATSNWWLYLRAYNDSITALQTFFITHTNQDIYIVTSRVPTAGMTVTQQTERWIRSCGVTPLMNYLGVIVAPHPERKAELYDALDFDYSIDDKAETVEQCDALANHRAFLLNRSWNTEAQVKHRVNSVLDFLKHIK